MPAFHSTLLASMRLYFRTGNAAPQDPARPFCGENSERQKLLRQSFTGQVRATRMMPLPAGDGQVLRNRRDGLFDLGAFRRLFRGPSSRPLPAGPGRPAGAGDPDGPSDRTAPVGTVGLGDQAGPQIVAAEVARPSSVPRVVKRLEDCKARLAAAQTRDTTELRSDRTSPGRFKSLFAGAEVRDRTRQVIFARDAANQENERILADLHALRAEVRRDPLPDEDHQALLVQLHALQRRCVKERLLLALPGFERLPDLEMLDLTAQVHALDDLLRSAASDAGTAYRLDKTIALLASHGRILEYADSPLQGAIDRAAAGLAAMADTVTCAAAPPSDGSALDTLFGIDADLDAVLKQVRLHAAFTLLKQGAAASTGCQVEELSAEHCDKARADARQLVDQDIRLARLRQRLLRALEKGDGRGMVTGLNGLKVDAALVKGLRATFGTDAEKTGLIIAALAMAEREAQQSPSAQRLKEAIEGRIGELQSQRKQLAGPALAASSAPLREIDTQIRTLQARLRGLQSEVDHCAGELEKAERAVAGLEVELQRALKREASEQEALEQEAPEQEAPEQEAARRAADAARPPEPSESIERRLEMARSTRDYWTARSAAIAVSTRADADNRVPQAGDRRAPNPVDYRTAAHYGGLTQAELSRLGLSVAESRVAMETVAKLAEKGLGSAAQVEAVVRDANRAIDSLTGQLFSLRSPLSRMIGDHQTTLSAAKNEQQARNFADLLLRDLTRGQPARDDVPTRVRNGLMGSPERPGPLAALTPDRQPAEDALRGLAQQYGNFERALFDLTGAISIYDQLHTEAREVIQAFDPSRTPDHPHGMALSSTLLEAVELLRWEGDKATVAPADEKRFKTLCGSLRGLDESRLTQASRLFRRRAPAPTVDDIERMAKNRQLMEAARAIVFLREDEAAARRRVHEDIANTVEDMDGVLDRRIAAMGEGWKPLRNAIRAAVLAQLGETRGATVDNFQPAEHAGAIKQRLRLWGVPVEQVLPEIHMLLSQSFGPEELNEWVRTTGPDAAREIRGASAAAEDNEDSREAAKSDLLAGIDRMASGTKLKLTAGRRVELQTGNIPLEPTATASMNVRVAAGKLDGLEIERGGDGYLMVLRDGWDGRVGSEVNVQSWVANAVGVKLQAAVELEGSGYRATGLTLRFPSTEGGKAALKDLVTILMAQGRIEARNLSLADEIMPLVERRVAGKASAGFKLAFDPLGAEGLPATGSVRPTVRARLKGNLAGSRSHDSHEAGNTNLVIRKRDTTTTVEVSAALAVNFRTQDTATTPALYSISTDLAALQVTAVPYHLKVKEKEIRGPDGLVRSAEMTRQCFAPPQALREKIVFDHLGGGDGFRRLLASLEEAERQEIGTLIGMAEARDIISVTFVLDERVKAAANEYLQQAKALRAGRSAASSPTAALERARVLEDRAAKLLADRDNYIPARLQLIPTVEMAKTLPGVNLLFASWVPYNDGKSEWVAVEVRFDSAKARAAAQH